MRGIVLAIMAVMALSAAAVAQDENGAIVIQDDFCMVNIPAFMASIFSEDVQLQGVITPSGNEKITCHGTLMDWVNTPDKAEKFDVPCWMPNGIGDGFVLVTHSGQWTAQCHLKK